MVHDITTDLAKDSTISISLITQSNITNGLNYKGVNILKRSWKDIFKNFKFNYFFEAISISIKQKISIKKLPNIILYYISMGYCKKVIEKGNFELIHIHGISHYTIPLIDLCEKYNFKYMVTLHGLNSFYKDDNENITWNEKKYIKHFYKNNISVSVISAGIRKKIMRFLNLNNTANFKVINNGFKKPTMNKCTDIRKKYSIPKDCKIMLCVGGISKRKNQEQVLTAFNKVDKKIKDKLYIIFLGYDTTNGKFEKMISHQNLMYAGFVERNQISSYYEQANFNLLVSKHEGFGLSTIEGFSNGLPLLTYADLEVVEDIFNKDSVILMNERSDYSLAKGIEMIYRKKWNKNAILKHSEKFSLMQMTKNYITHYKQLRND